MKLIVWFTLLLPVFAQAQSTGGIGGGHSEEGAFVRTALTITRTLQKKLERSENLPDDLTRAELDLMVKKITSSKPYFLIGGKTEPAYPGLIPLPLNPEAWALSAATLESRIAFVAEVLYELIGKKGNPDVLAKALMREKIDLPKRISCDVTVYETDTKNLMLKSRRESTSVEVMDLSAIDPKSQISFETWNPFVIQRKAILKDPLHSTWTLGIWIQKSQDGQKGREELVTSLRYRSALPALVSLEDESTRHASEAQLLNKVTFRSEILRDGGIFVRTQAEMDQNYRTKLNLEVSCYR